MDIRSFFKKSSKPKPETKGIDDRIYKTHLKEIISKNKFDWQDELINCIEEGNGLNSIMSRTGSGKSKASYLIFREMLKMDGDSTTYYVPNNAKILIKQVYDKFKEYLDQDAEVYECNPVQRGKNFGYRIILNNGHKLYIEPFIANTDSPVNLLEKFDSRNFVIFDEFDAVQTQLGLIHGGCSSKYSKTTIREHQTNFDKTKFNFFERLCNRTRVFAFLQH
jgi:hypothetical protein